MIFILVIINPLATLFLSAEYCLPPEISFYFMGRHQRLIFFAFDVISCMKNEDLQPLISLICAD